MKVNSTISVWLLATLREDPEFNDECNMADMTINNIQIYICTISTS